MATTTNYGWTTPDDTALVKDGAAAIRTLGSSVDTTTKNLNPETTLGDIAYRSSSANVKTRLGIGSAGQVLTVAAGVPSWATPAVSASGLTFITSASPSAVSTISIDNCFTSTYRNYLIVTNLECTASGGVYLNARLRAGGADNTSSNYKWNAIIMDSSSATVGGDNRSSTTSFTIARSRETGETVTTTYLYSPQASVETTFTTNAASLSSTDSDWFSGGGSMTVTTAYDGLTLFVGGGNFTGTIRVYGVSNS